MPIDLNCPVCQAALSVPAEYAGKRAKCNECGGALRIPGFAIDLGPSAQDTVTDLEIPQELKDCIPDAADVTRDDLPPPPAAADAVSEKLAELAGLGRHGVFVEIDLASYPANSLAGLLAAGSSISEGVRCRATEDLDPAARSRLLTALAQEVRRGQSASGSSTNLLGIPPFDLKGDYLGMPLADFKAKHRRPGQGLPTPYCSDQAPGRASPDLLYEPWRYEAGIVHARLDYPAEENPPTLAGVETDLMLFQFLDGRLFQIGVWFAASDQPRVSAALRKKFGNPEPSEAHSARTLWRRPGATAMMQRGALRPPKPSQLLITDDQLAAEAAAREPDQDLDV